MTEKLLVVIGITGNQGGSVARTFFKTPGWKVRGITRNLSSAAADDLRAQGAELVQANLDDVASLEHAFKGAHAIFAVTDFWQFVWQPSTAEGAARAGKSINEYAADLEIQQAKNIFAAASKVLSTENQLERFILSTLSYSKKLTNGEITWNWHFDGKAIFTEYLKETYKPLAAISSYLQMGSYLENMSGGLPFGTPTKQADGTYIIKKPPGAQGNHPIPFVHAQHDTGPLVKGLLTSPPGITIVGYHALLTWTEFLELWQKVTGHKIQPVEASMEELAATGIPEFILKEVIESATYATKYGWAGGEEGILGPADVNVDQNELLNLEQWIAEQKWG